MLAAALAHLAGCDVLTFEPDGEPFTVVAPAAVPFSGRWADGTADRLVPGTYELLEERDTPQYGPNNGAFTPLRYRLDGRQVRITRIEVLIGGVSREIYAPTEEVQAGHTPNLYFTVPEGTSELRVQFVGTTSSGSLADIYGQEGPEGRVAGALELARPTGRSG